jgi:hypothetical protein
MTNKIIYFLIVVAIVLGLVSTLTNGNPDASEDIMCTQDVIECPDGSYVGRTGPECEFNCPAIEIPDDIQASIRAKADLITVDNPQPLTSIESPLELSGEARGYWFFEADAPVVLTDWDGNIIAESYISVTGDWMTEDMVPFAGELTFDTPYDDGDPDYMKNGTLIFQKDNPSGLPEHDDALAIPLRF